MSMKAFRWAKTWNGLTPYEKFVLVMIADHYNDAVRRSWPSQLTLARETGMSPRSVARSVSALERNGLIEVEPWVNNSTGARLTKRYCLPFFDALSTCETNLPVYAEFDSAGNALAA